LYKKFNKEENTSLATGTVI